MKRKGVLIALALLSAVVTLTGCASSLIGVDNDLQSLSPHLDSSLHPPYGVVTGQGGTYTISVNTSVNWHLDGSAAKGRWGDWDWYKLQAAPPGTPITLTLTATGNFSAAVWKDGQFTSWNTYTSSLPKALNDTAGSNTWIWVGAWESSGTYTLTVTAQSGQTVTLEGSWSAVLTNAINNTTYTATLRFTEINGTIWGEMKTELTSYSIHGQHSGTRFVLDLVNSIYSDRTMTLAGSVLDANHIQGTYDAKTIVPIYGLPVPLYSHGQWNASRVSY